MEMHQRSQLIPWRALGLDGVSLNCMPPNRTVTGCGLEGSSPQQKAICREDLS